MLLAGTVLPALSGVILWMRRQNPERLWAADQLTRGRVLVRARSRRRWSTACSAASAIAALGVFADWAALGIAGFIPSISREVDVVDAGVGTIVGETIGAASFLALGICLAVEALDRVRLNPMVSTAVVAIGAGLAAASNQNSILAGLPLIAGQAAGAALAVVLIAGGVPRRLGRGPGRGIDDRRDGSPSLEDPSCSG